jgi:hypothetical protein
LAEEGAMSTQQRAGVARLNQIYEQYVKPVEQDHQGEYVLVRPDGELIFAPSMLELVEKAYQVADRNNCLFKVGEISAANIL